MKKCAGAVGTLADKGSEVPRMDETLKLRWLYCPDVVVKQERRYVHIRY